MTCFKVLFTAKVKSTDFQSWILEYMYIKIQIIYKYEINVVVVFFTNNNAVIYTSLNRDRHHVLHLVI